MTEVASGGALRIAIATIVHHPLDARIHARQIEAMLRAGHQVTYAAPFGATSTPFDARINCHDLPRAQGRRRLRARRVASQWLRAAAREHDVVLVHDPELVAPLMRAGRATRAHLVWDVHEDNPAAIRSRDYLPVWARLLLSHTMRRLEVKAERKLTLLLAETAYQQRFRRRHAVVPNTPWVNDAAVAVTSPRLPRVVYVGSITRVRGAEEMCLLGAALREYGVEVHLIGSLDDTFSRDHVRAAAAAGDVIVHGRLANTEALKIVAESLAGLSLLQDTANHRHSMPTKLLEYAACGTASVTTALELAADMIDRGPGGIIIPLGSPAAVAQAAQEAIAALAADPAQAASFGRNALATVRDHYNWNRDSQSFLAALRPPKD